MADLKCKLDLLDTIYSLSLSSNVRNSPGACALSSVVIAVVVFHVARTFAAPIFVATSLSAMFLLIIALRIKLTPQQSTNTVTLEVNTNDMKAILLLFTEGF
jgi:hypothetical protein